MAENETVAWSEVCQKVSFGDGLYQSCRDKVKGFSGLDNSAYDDVDFDQQLTGSALSVPEPPPGDLPRQREGLFGPMAVREETDTDAAFFSDVPKMAIYAGLAAVVWFLLRKKAQPVAATEDAAPPAETPVTGDQAA